MYKLVKFLVGRLSESSGTGKSADGKEKNPVVKISVDNSKRTPKELAENIDDGADLQSRLKDLRLRTEVVDPSVINRENDSIGEFSESDSISQKTMEVVGNDNQADESTRVENGRGLMENFQNSINSFSANRETVVQEDSKHVPELEQNPISHPGSSKMSYEIEKLRNQKKLLLEEVKAKSLELQHLEEKQELLKAAVEMAFSEQNPVDYYIKQLHEEVDAKTHDLVELESKCDAVLKLLEERKRSLEEAQCAGKLESREKFQKLKEIELDTRSILSETKKRDKEISKLSAELEKQPKVGSRRSYLERIKAITKNSRKQDIDIERILKDTRELQLESNTIQERLHRTYAVVDETVSREAKKDQVGQQAYRLLTSIHASFQQISEKILATDRAHREAADHEAKLAAIASWSLNIDKLQADLDAIRKENEFLRSKFNYS